MGKQGKQEKQERLQQAAAAGKVPAETTTPAAGRFEIPQATEFVPSQPTDAVVLYRIFNNVGRRILFIQGPLMSGHITACSFDEDVFSAALYMEDTVKVSVKGGTVSLQGIPGADSANQTLNLKPVLHLTGLRHFDPAKVNLSFENPEQMENPMQFIFADEGLDYATTILDVQRRNEWRKKLIRERG